MIEVIIVEYADIQEIMENSQRVRPSQHFLKSKAWIYFFIQVRESFAGQVESFWAKNTTDSGDGFILRLHLSKRQ